jgi:hypothetical protein
LRRIDPPLDELFIHEFPICIVGTGKEAIEKSSAKTEGPHREAGEFVQTYLLRETGLVRHPPTFLRESVTIFVA